MYEADHCKRLLCHADFMHVTLNLDACMFSAKSFCQSPRSSSLKVIPAWKCPCATKVALTLRSSHFITKLLTAYVYVGAANTSRKLLDSGCATPFDQCGGETCMGGRGSTTCVDAAYTCCPSSYTCQRQNSQRWQCMPERTAAGTQRYLVQHSIALQQGRKASLSSSTNHVLLVHASITCMRSKSCIDSFDPI